jgi:asparagine N-glycosylation enzyme membrane subunit Stt3
MTSPKRQSPLILPALASAVLGVVAWVWVGDWRWAVTGLAVMLLLAMAGLFIDGRKQP